MLPLRYKYKSDAETSFSTSLAPSTKASTRATIAINLHANNRAVYGMDVGLATILSVMGTIFGSGAMTVKLIPIQAQFGPVIPSP